MPAARRSSIPIWDPITAFEIPNQDHGNEITCQSPAKPKHRRCRRSIAKHNQDAVLQRIEQLSYLQPKKASRDLRNLVILSLCPRNHSREEDIDILVNKWQRIIDREQQIFELEQKLQSLLENLNRLGRRLNHEEQERIDQLLEDLDELDRTDQDSVDELVENFDQLERDLNGREQPHGAKYAASEEEQAITLRPLVTQTLEVEPDDEEIDVGLERLMLEQQSMGPVELHLAETTPRPPESTEAQTPILEHCREIHVSRRPTGEDCPICTVSMADSSLRDLVWCKARCGRSVHRTCFEAWRSRSGQDLKCVYCRAAWQNACIHDIADSIGRPESEGDDGEGENRGLVDFPAYSGSLTWVAKLSKCGLSVGQTNSGAVYFVYFPYFLYLILWVLFPSMIVQVWGLVLLWQFCSKTRSLDMRL